MGDERKRYFRDDLDSSQGKDEPKFELNGDSFLFRSSQAEPVEPADSAEPVNPMEPVEPLELVETVEPTQSVKHIPQIESSISQDDIQNDLQDDLHEEFEEVTDSPDYVAQLRQIIPTMSLVRAKKLIEEYQGEEDIISKAVSSYFEGPIEKQTTAKRTSSITGLQLLPAKRPKDDDSLRPPQHQIRRSKGSTHWRKFIGSLQVNAMATRPTLRPLKYGHPLEIIKSSGDVAISRLYNSNGRKKVSMASFVKIYDSERNREIGRIPEDIAQILYPLVDTDEVEFEATMVFCENKRLSIGDGFILQLDCFLTSDIFDGSFKEATPSQSKRWGSSTKLVETDEELQSRSRRVGLLSLFDKLRLKNFDEKVDDPNIQEDRVEFIDLNGDEGIDGAQGITSEDKDFVPSDHKKDVMDLNQLKVFYKATQSSDSLKAIPETEPPSDTMNLTLRRYQKQGLTWMLRREQEFEKAVESQEFQDVSNRMMNPLWKCFKWPKDMSWAAQRMDRSVQPEKGEFFYANLHTGEFCLEKPVLKTTMKGGILSDEMGLGKTISALALIFTSSHDSSVVDKSPITLGENQGTLLPSSQSFKKPYAAKTTLIIVPTSLLTQWQSEFDKSNSSSDLYCEVYYGGNVNNLKTLLTKTRNPPSVVLTTYGIVQNEWSKMIKVDKRSIDEGVNIGLFSLTFYRLIIDEGHIIRNRTTSTSKAVMDISSKCRWVLTGTPIINRLDDLYSIVKFLKLEPWSQISYWKMFVSDPFERKDYRQAFDVVNAILEPVFLRRTKQMQDINGKPLVELPPKQVVVERLAFNNVQGAVYKHYLERAESSVRKGLARGDLLKKYSTILVYILRLRQICCDVRLVGTQAQDENDEDLAKENQIFKQSDDVNKIFQQIGLNIGSGNVDTNLLKTLKAKIDEKYPSLDSLLNLECSICTTEPIELHKVLLTECCHSFCEDCLKEYLEFQKQKNLELKCPNCRELINTSYLFSLELKDGKDLSVIPFRNVSRSTKIEALLKHCKILQETSPGEQIVVFSQFSSFLDIMESELVETFPGDSLKVYKFDGRLTLKERASVLREFEQKDFDRQKVLLMSLKTGGVGLNLTCASYAYMMDPWWSPSMEDQAIDRIHRIGQLNQVKVTRFIIENTIEEKMLKIQERKRTIGEAMDADEEERRKRRIDEIQMLFE